MTDDRSPHVYSEVRLDIRRGRDDPAKFDSFLQTKTLVAHGEHTIVVDAESWLATAGETAVAELRDPDLAILGAIMLPHAVDDWLLEFVVGEKAIGRRVRVALSVDEDLAALPWEACFYSREQYRGVSLVRISDTLERSAHEIRVGDDDVHVSLVHAFAKEEDSDLVRVRASLEEQFDVTPLGGEYSQVLDRGRRADVAVDVLHFSAHGDSDGGVMLLDGPSHLENLSDGKGVLRVPRRSLRQDRLRSFVRMLRPKVVVIASCSQGRGQWSLASALASIDGVAAVIAMRDPILENHATTFCLALYESIAHGEPLDEAMLSGRRALWGAVSAVPQLHLNVAGDTRLVHEGPPALSAEEAEGSGSEAEHTAARGAAGASGARAAERLAVLAVGDDVWSVGAADSGALHVSEIDGRRSTPATLTSDGRFAITEVEGGVRVSALVVRDDALEGSLVWARALPDRLAGGRVLAAALVYDSMLRLVIGSAGRTWEAVGGTEWLEPRLLADFEAVSAIATIAGTFLLDDEGRLHGADGAASPFTALAKTDGVDATESGGVTIAVAWGSGPAGWGIDAHVWDGAQMSGWHRAAFGVDDAHASGIGAVREYDSTMPARLVVQRGAEVELHEIGSDRARQKKESPTS